MKGVDFPESNLTLVGDGCQDIKAFKSEEIGVIITCWEMSDEDLEIIKKTKKIWLWVHGKGHPPVNIEARLPFNDTSEFPDLIEVNEP